MANNITMTRHEAVTTLRDLDSLPFKPSPESMIGKIRQALAEALATPCARCGNPASDDCHSTQHAFRAAKVLP